MKTLKVVDLFCGPGGISEGLRQAGLVSVYALDKDRAATDTFAKNHPEATVVRADVTGFDPDSLPDFDVLVGGPPCIEFSSSKGSKGNILEGLRLVQEYLRVVYERAPRYWIMENVPRIVLHLPEEIPLKWIGVDKPGSLHVPVRTYFDCADFGVPQARRRFLMGNFPIPQPTHTAQTSSPDLFSSSDKSRRPWVMLGEILRALPDPLRARTSGVVTDPNYGFEFPCEELTDHFHPVLLNERETRNIRNAKVAHPFMGRMAFPDEEDRPARTVVATQLGRETLVIGAVAKGKTLFRRATVRECATLQSFPVSYQFFGGSLNARYRLAGDAVPPRLSYLIGQEIRRLEGHKELKGPLLTTRPSELSPPASLKPPRVKPTLFPMNRRFGELVPGKEVRGCRVELDNSGINEPMRAQLAKGDHVLLWKARLYIGEGRANLKTETFAVQAALEEVASYCAVNLEVAKRFEAMLRESEKRLAGRMPDASTLQASWTGRCAGTLGPEQIVDELSALVDKHFPAQKYANTFMPLAGKSRIVPDRGLRVRLAAALVLTAYCAALINEDTRWVEVNSHSRFVSPEWPTGGRTRAAKKVHLCSPADQLSRLVRSRASESAFHVSHASSEVFPSKAAAARSA